MRLFVTGLRGIPAVMGGVESHCEELLPRIAKLRPDIEITVLARRPYVAEKAQRYRGVAVRGLPSPRAPGIEALLSTAIGVLYARLKGADVLHIHAIGPGLMTPVARMLGLRTVVTYHSRNYEHAKWGRFARLMLRLGERVSMKYAQRVIVVAPWLINELARAYPSHAPKLAYVPNGVPDLPSGEEEDEAALEPGYVLAVGRLVQEKGFDYLIEAYRRSGSRRKLVIAGDADHESTYSRALLAQADESVIFTGRVPRTRLARLYRNAGLFVLPSFHEGLPISALEAAACNTPMLLSDIPANRDLGLPERHYFPAGDAERLAHLLGSEPVEFGTDYQMITSTFDWDFAATRTAEILSEVVEA